MKNVLKILMGSAFVLLSACGGLENTVSNAETTYRKLDNGNYRVLADIDCVGGGMLGSDNCEGSEVCVTATFQDAQNAALESVVECKNLVGVGITTFTLISEKELDDAVSILIELEVKNDALSVFEVDTETTVVIQK